MRRNTRGDRSGLALAGRLGCAGKEMLSKCANHHNYTSARGYWLAVWNNCWLGSITARGHLNAGLNNSTAIVQMSISMWYQQRLFISQDCNVEGDMIFTFTRLSLLV
jgi:hypothetical protein